MLGVQHDGDPRPLNHSGRGLAAPTAAGAAERQERRDRQRQFERQEVREMRQERVSLLGKVLCWAVIVALPCAPFAWGLAYLLGLFPERLGPGWTSPGVALSLLLGALCGAVGG